MSSNKGIFKVEKIQLNDFADGKIEKVNSINYGKNDGMRTSECNGGYQSSGCKTKDGKLIFPTTKGIVVIDPENIKINKNPPPVIIEKVLLNGNPADLISVVEVKPEINRIEVYYTALSYVNPERVKFKYRLQGFEEKWISVNVPRDRVATYTNLSAGAYTFQIMACNNDGIWNEKPASIGFLVIPPFWKSWWFTLFALLVFAIFSYMIINFFKKYITFSTFWKKQKYVGQFRLLERIGVGGMGTIYKAHNLMDKSETVAVKVLKEELFPDESHRKRFIQEAAIIDQLNHPNIIKIIERGQYRQKLFIAMELLEGVTLEKKIEQEGMLDLKEALVIMIQVTDALVKIHSKNIVHRDLKPANVMLIEKSGNQNFVKLLDFGLAKTQFQSRVTETGMVVGTINYMAPEQLDSGEFSAASDIYSLGVIFFEMVTGKKPFFQESPTELMKQILNQPAPDPNQYRTDLPVELNDLIKKMLKKEGKQRPEITDAVTLLRHLFIAYT